MCWQVIAPFSYLLTAIFSNICTAHAQKRLFMNFRCKFRHYRSIRVQNFGDLATFFVDYCILCSECPPYFYFRFVWPTDLESIPHASTPTLIIPTKFTSWYVHTLLSYSVFVCWHVILWPWPSPFWPCAVVMYGQSRDQPCHQVRRP